MESVNLVTVWYNETKPIYNNIEYPFLHNLEYHSLKYKVFVLYYIDNDENIRMKTKSKNIFFLNMKKVLPEFCKRFKDKTISNAEKIDYIKLCAIKNLDKLFGSDLILMMDMDCEVVKINQDYFKESERFIEPVFEREVKLLKRVEYSGGFDSYIENYALLINPKSPFRSFISLEKYFIVKDLKKSNNCLYYSSWIDMIYDYYQDAHGFIFPEKIKDLNFKSSLVINYERGGSWFKQHEDESYEYNPRGKPIFSRDRSELTAAIYFQDFEKILTMIKMFKENNYNFKRKFGWSNSLQVYVNLKGFIIDKIENFDFNGLDFLGRIQTFKK